MSSVNSVNNNGGNLPIKSAKNATNPQPIDKVSSLGSHSLEMIAHQNSGNGLIPLEARRLSHVLPPLSGPYKVGYSSHVVEVPKNSNSFPKCNKKIGVEIFAPAHDGRGNKVLMDLISDNFNQIMLMRAEDLKDRKGITPDVELQEQQIQTLYTQSVEGFKFIGKYADNNLFTRYARRSYYLSSISRRVGKSWSHCNKSKPSGKLNSGFVQ